MGPHAVRLYSIASSRYGDDMTGNTGSMGVRRATYWCPELKADDPAKKGICSNFLCDSQPGTELTMTGPSGKVMLMPEEDPNTDGGKMYIQDKVAEYADEIFNKLENGAHIYFCGLKGMMPGIQDMLADVCKSKDIDYTEWLKGLKKSKQWHVEVY